MGIEACAYDCVADLAGFGSMEGVEGACVSDTLPAGDIARRYAARMGRMVVVSHVWMGVADGQS